jgi:uncharacterized protein
VPAVERTLAPRPRAAPEHPARRRAARTLQIWASRLHVYLSMGTLLLVLFFALTGITLNRPELALGSRLVFEETERPIAATWLDGERIDWLAVAESLRAEHGVRGQLTHRYEDAFGGQLSFRGPGFGADVYLDTVTGTFLLATESHGLVGILNDLHRGRTGGPTWRWVVDAAGVIMALVSITGIVILLSLKRMRTAGLVAAALGIVMTAPFVWLALS